MLNDEEKELVHFVQTYAPQLPVQSRIKVYRAMAGALDGEASRIFVDRAQILEDADRRCRELDLNFVRRG
jgi:hypothetical protein